MSASSKTATDAFYLAAGDLAAWLDKQAETRRVLAPVQEGGIVVFRPLQPGQPPLMERARVSPKAAVMPTGETLLRFTAQKDSADPGTLHLSLDDMAGKDAPETLIFACRSCDARGFLALDKAYLHGPYQDPYYAARREATTIMALTCAEPCPTCFCHWVGGGPDSAEGADVTFTAVADGYVLQAHSPKGKTLLEGLGAARAAMIKEAEAIKAKARAEQAAAPDLAEAPARIAARFGDTAFWQAQTAKCLACGACTYMCPTCY
ncbi:MAG: hydrogenase, partial [Deltaproteobacteria bacterium]|nr:hydrogenase [Deltaproteobacteria bacterium]